jgi:hypothetical protein
MDVALDNDDRLGLVEELHSIAALPITHVGLLSPESCTSAKMHSATKDFVSGASQQSKEQQARKRANLGHGAARATTSQL